MERLLAVSSSPHIHAQQDTKAIMAWVLAALAPAGLAGIYFFGLRAAAVMAVCVAKYPSISAVTGKTDRHGRRPFRRCYRTPLAYNLPLPLLLDGGSWKRFCNSRRKTVLRRHRLQHRQPCPRRKGLYGIKLAGLNDIVDVDGIEQHLLQ